MDLDTNSLYRTLGVSNDSTPEEIRSAYRRLALFYHPNRANAPEDPDLETKFRQIADAYKILGDPQKRPVYDTFGTMGVKATESDIGLLFPDTAHLIRAIFAYINFQFLLCILFVCFLSIRIDKLIAWDFNIVFIPLWIMDWNRVVISLLLIAIASGIIYHEKFDDSDIQTPTMNAERMERRKKRRRNFRIIEILKSILDLLKILALIAFQVLIVKKTNDPSGIATPIVSIPYFVWEGLSFFGEFIAIPNSTKAALFSSKLTLAAQTFTWTLIRVAFATLIILRVDEHITCSWHVVSIPLYLAGVLRTINLLVEAIETGAASDLCTALLGSTLFVVSLPLPLIIMLAGKLDGKPYSVSHALIPGFIFLSVMFCCTGCYLPNTLASCKPMGDLGAAEEVRREEDRQWESQLLTSDSQSQNNSFASAGSSTQINV